MSIVPDSRRAAEDHIGATAREGVLEAGVARRGDRHVGEAVAVDVADRRHVPAEDVGEAMRGATQHDAAPPEALERERVRQRAAAEQDVRGPAKRLGLSWPGVAAGAPTRTSSRPSPLTSPAAATERPAD